MRRLPARQLAADAGVPRDNEVYLCWSMLQQESDRRIAQLWELNCNMEIGQLHVACDLLRRFQGMEPEEILPASLPSTPVTFEPSKAYVREVLAHQIDLRTGWIGYVPVSDLAEDHRYFSFQERVNAGGSPMDAVVDEARRRRGHEYRDETEGQSPVERLRVHAA